MTTRSATCKLIICLYCEDVFKLSPEVRRCACGKSGGQCSEDGDEATYFGDAVPLGFKRWSLIFALRHRPEQGLGQNFEAFVIPHDCHNFKWSSDNPLPSERTPNTLSQ